MLWKKPQGMKYTDLCIYIDKNVPIIAQAGLNPAVEDTVYNYLWLLVKALAIKKRMFESFQDYDPYCFYAANRLFLALRKNYLNQGKTIRGRLIRPIKSCLNYTKVLLYPMKVEYQRQSYQTIIAEDWVSKRFDALQFSAQLKENAKQSYGLTKEFWYYAKNIMQNSGSLLDTILAKSPFIKDSLDYKHLKMTLLINCFYGLKNKKKFDLNPAVVIMWKLPRSMVNYIRILLREFVSQLKNEIMSCYDSLQIDESLLEKIISVQKEEYEDYE